MLKVMQDLRDLFRVVPHELDKSETQQTLHQLHSGQRKATAYVQEHLQFLETLPRYAGLPLLLVCIPAVFRHCLQLTLAVIGQLTCYPQKTNLN